jgi:hypothetical protein
VRLNAANGEAAAMKINQGRQALRVGSQAGRKQSGLHHLAISHGYLQVFDPRQSRFWQVQDAGGHFVKQAGLLHIQHRHRRTPCPLDVCQHQAHGIGQSAVGVALRTHVDLFIANVTD